MICYMDMTWCPEWIHERCTKQAKCNRVLTEEVQANAVKWWGSDEAPLCMWSAEPTCFNAKEYDNERKQTEASDATDG